MPSILNEDQKKVIHEHYTADKDKSTRNYTLPFSEQWSYREDTTLRTYAMNLSLMNRISENIWKMSFLALREERHPMLKGMLMRVRCQTETLGYGDAQMMLL